MASDGEYSENEELQPLKVVQTLRAEFDIYAGRLREKIISLEDYYSVKAIPHGPTEADGSPSPGFSPPSPTKGPEASSNVSVYKHKIMPNFGGVDGGRSQSLTDGTRSLEVAQGPLLALRSHSLEVSGASAGEPPALEEHRLRRRNGPMRRFVPIGTIHSIRSELGTDIRLHNRWLQLSMQCDSALALSEFRSATKPASNEMQHANSKKHSDLTAKLLKSLHPGGRLRLWWDTLAMLLLFVDAALLPVSLAWGWDKSRDTVDGIVLLGIFGAGVVFWTLDIIMNFNTSFFSRGTLITTQPAIFRHYLGSWFLLDLTLVILDCITFFHLVLEMVPLSETAADFGTDLTFTRFARALRISRLARLVKVARIESIAQEYAATLGRQWVVLIVTFLNTVMATLLIQHMASCLWFGIGMLRHDQEEMSWIELAGIQNSTGFTQYIHSFRYIMLPLRSPTLAIDNTPERFFDILYTGFWLVLLGSSISRIVLTIFELTAMNESKSKQRREIRRYLRTQEASFQLVTRVMNFVDYKLEKLSLINFDASLISETLQTELCVNQRSRYLETLPICKITKDLFPDVFSSVCTMLKKMVFENGEDIYVSGGWSTCLYISITGVYLHSDGLAESEPEELTGIQCFEELALYVDNLPHHSTLHAKTFAEMYILVGTDLVKCLENAPGCAGMFFEYAREFTHAVARVGERLDRKDLQTVAERCCKKTRVYQEIFPDEKFNLQNISSSHDLLQSADNLPTIELEKRGIAWLLKEGWLEDLEESTLPNQLRNHLFEIHPDTGSHVIFEQPQDRDRAEASCISILALIANRYEIFTRPQEPSGRLRREQWERLQEVISWVRPTLDEIHTVLVLLAIRALGKSKFVMCQVPSHNRRPESALLYLMDYRSNVVPSIKELSENGLKCARATLRLHEAFNFAQMLQGENVPGNVMQLQVQVMREGEQAMRFYILFLLGFMSGLEAGRGSRFLTAQRAENVIEAIGMLQHLLYATPRGIYWGYLCARARSLRLPQQTPEDLVLLRLACLLRIEPEDTSSYFTLLNAWGALGQLEKVTLTNHFLADGIDEVTFVFEFLPDCVANSLKNPTVTLTGMLEILEELLHTLQPAVARNPDLQDAKVIPVDLSDMSEFIASVQNHFVFKTCLSRCKIRFLGRRAQLEMTGGNWGRIHEGESDFSSLAYCMRDIAHRQQSVEAHLLKLENSVASPEARHPTFSI